MNQPKDLLQNLENLDAVQLRRLLTDQLTRQKLGLYWESSAIERDAALNANIVLPRLVEDYSHNLKALAGPGTPNLIIEGDNYDSLRLLKSTHTGKIRVIYIEPPTTPATRTGCTTTAMWTPTTGGGTASGWSFCTAA